MSFYQLEDVLFGLMMGPDGYCVQALSRCEYKGTKSLTMDEEYRLMKKQVEETEVLFFFQIFPSCLIII